MLESTYNIYCDESCHLEKDNQKAMFLGGIWCPNNKVKTISNRIKEYKIKHGYSNSFEIKWTKISNTKIEFYLDLVDYFFDNEDLHFRCLIIPEKNELNHKKFNQNYNDFYYKMYFNMLKNILDPKEVYEVYIDIKDTCGTEKIKKLKEVLSNKLYDFDRKIIKRMQLIRSHESNILQLTDLFIGAISYNFRKLDSSKGKIEIIRRIKERSNYELNKTTLIRESKINLFVWNKNEKN